MYIRRKVFSVLRNYNTGEEKLFSTTEFLTQKEFGAHKRKQNQQLINADKNAEMQLGRAAKREAQIKKMADIIKNGGELTGKYKDMYNNGGYAADVDALIKNSNANLEHVQKHADAAIRDAGRVAEVSTKMSKQRKSLAQGGELHLQDANATQVTGQGKNRKGGRKVTMKDVRSLKGKKTVVNTEATKTQAQGGGKTKTQAVLNETQTKKVDKAASGPKIADATGKEIKAPVNQPTRKTEISITEPKNQVVVETPNKVNQVTGNVGSTKLTQENVKKGALKLGKKTKVGLGVAAATGLGIGGAYAYKKHKDKKTA